MIRSSFSPLRILSGAALVLAASTWSAADELPLDSIDMPDGFEISIYQDGVENARQMALGNQGTVFVGSRSAGKVHGVVDADQDGVPDRVVLIDEDLYMPSGLAYRDGALYVAAVNRILRYDDIENRLDDPPEPVVVSEALPSDRHHGWKYLGFGPDGKLYIPVGAPCNVCDEPGYSQIRRMNADGTGLEVFAEGVRNSVGFDWHPVTGVLWFTDNGRDWLGDELPACELNRAPDKGMHFGFPYCHQGDLPDPEFGAGADCSEYVAPAVKLGPHVAPLGMKFYTGQQFPADYQGQIFIAEHGSWNRSEKIGYRLTLVRVDDEGQVLGQEVFADGWLQGEASWGRPVDVLVMPDGSLLVSDDAANVIYRIRYTGAPETASEAAEGDDEAIFQ